MTDHKDLCKRLRERTATCDMLLAAEMIEQQAAHAKERALEYLSLSDQCDEHLARIAKLEAKVAAAEAAAIERCARWCDEYAGDRWDLYKGRAPYKGNEEGRANPRIEGESDGASACAEGLRSLLKHDY